jgi:hypothetical protein
MTRDGPAGYAGPPGDAASPAEDTRGPVERMRLVWP